MSPRHKMTDPIPILNQERPIESQLMIEIRDRAGVGERPEMARADIAGQQLARRQRPSR